MTPATPSISALLEQRPQRAAVRRRERDSRQHPPRPLRTGPRNKQNRRVTLHSQIVGLRTLARVADLAGRDNLSREGRWPLCSRRRAGHGRNPQTRRVARHLGVPDSSRLRDLATRHGLCHNPAAPPFGGTPEPPRAASRLARGGKQSGQHGHVLRAAAIENPPSSLAAVRHRGLQVRKAKSPAANRRVFVRQCRFRGLAAVCRSHEKARAAIRPHHARLVCGAKCRVREKSREVPTGRA